MQCVRIYLYSMPMHAMSCIYLQSSFFALWHRLSKGPDGELGVLCSALQRPRRPGGGPGPPGLASSESLPLFLWISLVWTYTMGCKWLQHVTSCNSVKWQALPIGVGSSCGLWQKWIHQLPSCERVGGKISAYYVVLHYCKIFQVEVLQPSLRFKEQREVWALLLFHPPISLLCFCPGNLLDCDVEWHKRHGCHEMSMSSQHNIAAHFWSVLAGLGCWALPIDLLLAHAPVWGGKRIVKKNKLRQF